MKAYSRDLRVRVLDALDGGMPRREVVRVCGVSSPTITRWRRRRRETGSPAPSPRPGPPGLLLHDILSASDALQHTRWHSKQDFFAGREDRASPAP